MQNGYASLSLNGKYGVINDKCKVCIPAIYTGVVEPYNAGGYAVLLNQRGEEVKVNYEGREIGYTEHQNQLFAEAKRQAEAAEKARLAEEARKAEEKRIADRKAAETRKYDAIKSYYVTLDDVRFSEAYAEYMKEYAFDGSHRSEIEKMNENTKTRESRIAAGKVLSKWRLGNQVCVHYDNGIIFGLVEQFNEDRSSAQVKITACSKDFKSYKAQNIVKDGTIWVQPSWNWHLALDEETDYISSHNYLLSDIERTEAAKCYWCGGKGFIVCKKCSGKGKYEARDKWGDRYDKTCENCKGNGQYMCSDCGGRGKGRK